MELRFYGESGKPTNKDILQIVLSAMKKNVGYHEKTKWGTSFWWEDPGGLLWGRDIEPELWVALSQQREEEHFENSYCLYFPPNSTEMTIRNLKP